MFYFTQNMIIRIFEILYYTVSCNSKINGMPSLLSSNTSSELISQILVTQFGRPQITHRYTCLLMQFPDKKSHQATGKRQQDPRIPIISKGNGGKRTRRDATIGPWKSTLIHFPIPSFLCPSHGSSGSSFSPLDRTRKAIRSKNARLICR